MKGIAFKPVITMICVSALIGFAIRYFTDFGWLASTLIVMAAFMINGLAIFIEDLKPDGLDYQEGITDTPEARKEQKKLMRIQGAIVIALFILGLWAGFHDI